jgi:carbonic anhydrase/acetyltransferase-like protein (isoleucine patch superfamily)
VFEAHAGKFPRIAPTAFVHRAAVLIGDIEIGEQSSVWPHVTLRGDDGPIRIGSQTSIQDNTVIHCTEGLSFTTVGSRVTVGHSVILHGCTIHDDVLIGMGAIVLDNAVIERGSLVAAGTLVPPGKRVEAGTLVAGNPMRVIRACAEKEREMIEHGWKAYVKRAGEYLAAG